MEKKCAYPDCNNMGKAKGKRGKNSTVKTARRRKWCQYHCNGKGKAERELLTAKQLDN